MKKVLIINTIGFGYEGISNVILNYCRFMNKDGIELHIVCYSDTAESVVSIAKENAIVHRIISRKKKCIKYLKDLNALLRVGFDTIHINGNSATMCLETLLAKGHGINNIIVHGHSTSTNHPVINRLLRPLLIYTSDVRLACSNSAGNFLYKNADYKVLNNAIDTERFAFNEKKRELIRKKLGITNQVIIGNVGYFSDNKNQYYLLGILAEIRKKLDAKILFVGNYFDNVQFKRAVHELKIETDVIIVPATSEVDLYYNAMDMFAFPSKFEGLGLVMIEAQANGLPCIASKGVPKAGNLTGGVRYIDLNDKEKWVESVLRTLLSLNEKKRDETSIKNCELIAAKGFDIKHETELLRKEYMR